MEDLWEASVQGNLVGIRRAINLHGAKKLNGFDKKGITPLFLATSENKLDAIELLVTSGADVNLRSKGGYTPLMVAASEGYSSIMKFLLKNQANINLANDNGWTALICAASFNHFDCVKLLLGQPGVEVDKCSKAGCSALYLASREGFVEIVDILIKYGANVNITSLSGYTPLHIAAEQGRIDVVDLLLEAHADPTLLEQTGKNAWQIAKNEEVRERLYAKMLKRAIKSQPSFLVDVPVDATSQSSQSILDVVATQTSNDDAADISTVPAVTTTNTMFLTARQQLSLAQFASNASSDILSYLSQFGQQQQQAKLEMSYLLQHPALTDFYLYFHRSVSTTILGFQTLFSQLLVDNRESQSEQIVGMIDNLAQSSNIAAIPLITGMLTEIVKLPNDIHRARVLNHITKCFPSVESHRILEELARELTLEEKDVIQQTMRLTKTMTRKSAILQAIQRSAGWMYETFLLRGEESEYYSMNPVQTLATAYASRFLDQLMVLPEKDHAVWFGKKKEDDVSTEGTPPLTVSIPVTMTDLPVLKCYALGLESLQAYADHRQLANALASENSLSLADELQKCKQANNQEDAARASRRSSSSHRSCSPLPPIPASPQHPRVPLPLALSQPSTPPAKPARNRGSSSPAIPHPSSNTEQKPHLAISSASAPVSTKSPSTTPSNRDNNNDNNETDNNASATISLLQQRLALLESNYSQDQAQQQATIASLTQEIHHLRHSVAINKSSPKPPGVVSGSASSSPLGQMQIQQQQQDTNSSYDNDPNTRGTHGVLQQRQEETLAVHDVLLQSVITQLQTLQEDVQELHYGSGGGGGSYALNDSSPIARKSVPVNTKETQNTKNSNATAVSQLCVSSVPLSSPAVTGGQLVMIQQTEMPGVDPGADDIPPHHSPDKAIVAGEGGCCRIS